MAFGYLLGQEDAKKGMPFPEPSIQEQVIVVIEQHEDGEFDQGYAADLVFSLIYKWLDKTFEDKGFAHYAVHRGGYRHVLAEAFQPLVKPGVINFPLANKEKA